MSRCAACAQPVEEQHRFCPSCGSATDSSEFPTGTAPRRPRPTPTPLRSTGAASGLTGASGGGRFVAGTLLGGRYRVVGLLGQGGMGEVYRADDLRLEQPVALKFLPESLQHDRERLERFYNEVRMARQVSHASVCRVYDVGEADGLHFLSMEFVDGENLASLLRRIGRLPPDKALDIGRQLCAGLAAAHRMGVLHRDIKPANVMLDSQGHARLMDFGLAGVMASFQGDEVRSGTPAYMSPEQLEGREVTTRSEVYSLGLLLYEVFTGRKAFAARTRAELLRAHHEESPTHPSQLVPEIDPAVERAILRCLEKDPQRRPASALALAALLPGGDLLAAALAAGETPSPELVAAAGEDEGIRPAHAWALLGVLLAGLLAMPFLARSFQLQRRVPGEKSPEVLEDRARELLNALGAEPPRDRSRGFFVDREYFPWARGRGAPDRPWPGLERGIPPLVQFWYRQSPQPLMALRETRVQWTDPALDVAGMAGVRLDLQGRLLSVYRIPPQVEDDGDAAPPGTVPDWRPLFAAALLDPAAFRPVAPRWTPPFYCDTRAAWEGAYPGQPDLPLRVEAAGYRGRVAAFFTVSAWTRAERAQPHAPTRLQRVTYVLVLSLMAALLGLAAVLVRRHERRGRSDRRGAFRLAAFTLAAAVLALVLGADHVADSIAEVELMVRGLGGALLRASILWLLYLALEPYARRLWPRALVAWTRLLGGGLGDAVVGRDVLVGTAAGVGLALILSLPASLWPTIEPRVTRLTMALGAHVWASHGLLFVLDALALSLGALLGLTLLRLLLKREGWAALGLGAVLLVVEMPGMLDGLRWLAVPIVLGGLGAYIFLLVRFGLLAAVVGLAVSSLLSFTPLTSDLRAWYSQPSVLTIALVAALGIYGLRAAIHGRAARPA